MKDKTWLEKEINEVISMVHIIYICYYIIPYEYWSDIGR